MAYLLHAYFGRDGREEAEDLLARRSGNADRPRILGAFNEPIDDWLSFFMFTMFTDRDGKYQLLALAESGFDPLSRTTRFMHTEEAHHKFVGETGIGRVVQRSAELTKESKNGDARELGGVDLPTIQKYLNFWYSCSLDLFGGEISTNAASFFGAGLKGRAKEEKFADHLALEGSRTMDVPEDGKIVTREVPLRTAMNEVLRDSYVDDCQRGVDRWNKTLEAQGLAFRFTLPSRRFHPSPGEVFASVDLDVQGNPISHEGSQVSRSRGVAADRKPTGITSESLQQRAVVKPGEIWRTGSPPYQGDQRVTAGLSAYVRIDS